VAQVVEAYESHTPSGVHAELYLVEVDARVLRHFISNEEVDKNIGSWVLDPGTYRPKATLY
jgi:hypothetical protein